MPYKATKSFSKKNKIIRKITFNKLIGQSEHDSLIILSH